MSYVQKEMMDVDIAAAGISPLHVAALNAIGVMSLGDLTRLQVRDFTACDGIGSGGVQAVRRAAWDYLFAHLNTHRKPGAMRTPLLEPASCVMKAAIDRGLDTHSDVSTEKAPMPDIHAPAPVTIVDEAPETASRQTVIDPRDLDAYRDIASLSVDALDIDANQIRILKLLGARQVQDLHGISLSGVFHDDTLHEEALRDIRKALEARRLDPKAKHRNKHRLPPKASSTSGKPRANGKRMSREKLIGKVPPHMFDIELRHLGLSKLRLASLRELGAQTIGDLHRLDVSDYTALKHVGVRSVAALRDGISRLELRLRRAQTKPRSALRQTTTPFRDGNRDASAPSVPTKSVFVVNRVPEAAMDVDLASVGLSDHHISALRTLGARRLGDLTRLEIRDLTARKGIGYGAVHAIRQSVWHHLSRPRQSPPEPVESRSAAPGPSSCMTQATIERGLPAPADGAAEKAPMRDMHAPVPVMIVGEVPEHVAGIDIDRLHHPSLIRAALRDLGVRTIGDLAKTRLSDFAAYRSVGSRSLATLRRDVADLVEAIAEPAEGVRGQPPAADYDGTSPIAAHVLQAVTTQDVRRRKIIGAALGIGRPLLHRTEIAAEHGLTVVYVSMVVRDFARRITLPGSWASFLVRRASRAAAAYTSVDALAAEPWATGLDRPQLVALLRAVGGVTVEQGLYEMFAIPLTQTQWGAVLRKFRTIAADDPLEDPWTVAEAASTRARFADNDSKKALAAFLVGQLDDDGLLGYLGGARIPTMVEAIAKRLDDRFTLDSVILALENFGFENPSPRYVETLLGRTCERVDDLWRLRRQGT